MLGSCWGYVGVMLGPCWGHVGVILGSSWGHLGVILGSSWGHLGVILGSSWVHLGVILGSSWGYLGVILGSSWGSDNNVRTHVGGYIIMYQGVPQGFNKCTENVQYRGHPPPLVHCLREGGYSLESSGVVETGLLERTLKNTLCFPKGGSST